VNCFRSDNKNQNINSSMFCGVIPCSVLEVYRVPDVPEEHTASIIRVRVSQASKE
jgi:hypothetical protein